MIIDGIEYTEEELDVLREYAKREKKQESTENESSLAAYLEIKEAGNENINLFLSKGIIPGHVINGEDLRNFMSKIETLYGIACKYGKSHTFPEKSLFREESKYNEIVGNYDYRVDRPREREWVPDSFKSFSKKRSETDQFKYGDEFSSHKLVLTGTNKGKSNKIPFIDVNHLLGENHISSGESEILLPPFQEFKVDKSASIIPQKGTETSINDPRNDYQLYVTENFRNPMNVKNQKSDGKELSKYNSDDNGITNAEMDLIVELTRKETSKTEQITEEESQTLAKLKNKLKTYTMTRFKSIQKLYMEHVLVAGNKIVKGALQQYPGITSFIQGKSPKERAEQIITVEDFRNDDLGIMMGMLRTPTPGLMRYSVLDKGYELISDNEVSQELVDSVLNSGNREGNKEITKLLSKRGLIMDEVLTVGNQITPQGMKNVGFVASAYNPKEANQIITVEAKDKIFENFRQFGGTSKLFSKDSAWYKLEHMGMKVLKDDEKKNFDRASRTGRTSEIANAYGEFMKNLEKGKSDVDIIK